MDISKALNKAGRAPKSGQRKNESRIESSRTNQQFKKSIFQSVFEIKIFLE